MNSRWASIVSASVLIATACVLHYRIADSISRTRVPSASSDKQALRDAPSSDPSIDSNDGAFDGSDNDEINQAMKTSMENFKKGTLGGDGSASTASRVEATDRSSQGNPPAGANPESAAPNPDWSSRKNRSGIVCLDGRGGATVLDPTPDVLYKCGSGTSAQGYDPKTGNPAGMSAECAGGCFPHAGDHGNGTGAICVMDRLGYEYPDGDNSHYKCAGDKLQSFDPKTQTQYPIDLTCPGGCAVIRNARSAAR